MIRLGLPLLLTLALACVASSVLAQPRDVTKEAKAHFDQGTALFKNKDYKGALSEFEAAYKLAPSWKLLIHIGIAQSRLFKYMDALRNLERYLKEGGPQIPEGYRQRVASELKKIRSFLAEVTVVVEGGPGEVKANGATIGRSPLRKPLLLGPGDYTIAATRKGFETATKKLKLISGAKVSITLYLVPLKGILQVNTRPSGAKISIDGRVVGKTPWEEKLPPARYKVVAKLEGYHVGRTTTTLVGGKKSYATIDLVKIPGPPPKPWYKKWYWWTAIGAGVAAGVAATVVGVTWSRYDAVIQGDLRTEPR